MIQKTRGIVLNFFPYKDTSIISRIYTEAFGLQSYIVNSVRKSGSGNKKNKAKIAFFQPLTLLDLVVYHRPHQNISRISELQCSFPYKAIPYDYKKSSIAIFLAEVLLKTVKEEEANYPLFNFIWNGMLNLDQSPRDFENFHLGFLLRLAGYLGFAPTSGRQMVNQIEEFKPTGLKDHSGTQMVDDLLNQPDLPEIKTNRATRLKVLEMIISFYKLHVANFGELKSLYVLHEIME